MKLRLFLLVLLLLVVPAAAFAGANQGAAVAVSCGNVSGTSPATCTALARSQCWALTPNVNTQLAPLRSWIGVYVVRTPGLTAFCGVDFGIQYNDQALWDARWTKCGALEVGTANWPLPGSGNTVVWANAQAGEAVLVGFFTVLKYAGYGAFDFEIGAHPTYGVARALDSTSHFDNLRYPAVANLGGQGGFNPCGGDPVKPTTWGRIKSQY